MNNELRWRQRFQNFESAYQTFTRISKQYESDKTDEITQIALVQAFEFTFELAWNTMKDYLENEGYDEVKNSKQTIRVAFQAELITDAEKWMEMVEKRNMASHAYNSVILKETVDFIYNEFYPSVKKLYEDLKKRI
ncbi:MAG: nucleotidyltransferase substrate binding protein [Candidatus Desantisbacteria bacterium]